jgi:hypothetical protein
MRRYVVHLGGLYLLLSTLFAFRVIAKLVHRRRT